MKYRLTLLILCFAFVAKAQINFGVSVSEGIDKLIKPSSLTSSLGFPHFGIQLFHSIKTKKISESIGLNYSPFLIKYKITFTDTAGLVIGNSKLISVLNRITLPVECWYSFSSHNSKRGFGIEGGPSFGFVYSQVSYQKGFDEINGVPYNGNGYHKIQSNTWSEFYFGGQLGIFSFIKYQSNHPLILNLSCSYSQSRGFHAYPLGLSSLYLKAFFLFGK